MKRGFLLGLMILTGWMAHGQKIIDTWNFTTGEDISMWMDLSGYDSRLSGGASDDDDADKGQNNKTTINTLLNLIKI